MNNKISIIMPVFNAAQHLDKSIGSVVEQTFTDFELIIIDDCSTDSSAKKIAEWSSKDNRIKTVSLDQNEGVSNARNKALDLAQYRYIALIDADDRWREDKLESQLAYHQQKRCAISCTAFKFGEKTVTAPSTVKYKDLLANNVVNTSSVMIDSNQVKLCFEGKDKAEDYLQWLQITKKYNIHFINKVLVERTVFDGLSADKLEMAKMRWKVYRQHEAMKLLPSVFYFCQYFFNGLKKYL